MFAITKVPADASEVTETLGTKDKFWYGNQRFLFKEARGGTGEDWAEKIAAQLAHALGMPHAEYDLADWDSPTGSVRGVVTPNFCPPGAALTLGNELLSEADPGYAQGQVSKFRVQAHTVERVLRTLEGRNPCFPLGWVSPASLADAVDVFIGYLLLDALIGNTDRHHENWGIVSLPERTVHLAPTFDHASSLGCHLLDQKRAERLRTSDRNFEVRAFAGKARSALYRQETDPKPLLTFEAFLDAAAERPAAARYWLERLDGLDEPEIAIIVNDVPRDRISDTAVEFAQTLIVVNKSRLVAAGRNLR
jgi:hypothetical protein